MPALPFASLSPAQQARVVRIFQDALFGSDPAAYSYELEAATGQLSGQRCQVNPIGKKIQQGKRASLSIATSGRLQFSARAASVLAGLILPDLLAAPGPSSSSAPALAALPVAGPGLPHSGRDLAGEFQGWYE